MYCSRLRSRTYADIRARANPLCPSGSQNSRSWFCTLHMSVYNTWEWGSSWMQLCCSECAYFWYTLSLFPVLSLGELKYARSIGVIVIHRVNLLPDLHLNFRISLTKYTHQPKSFSKKYFFRLAFHIIFLCLVPLFIKALGVLYKFQQLCVFLNQKFWIFWAFFGHFLTLNNFFVFKPIAMILFLFCSLKCTFFSEIFLSEKSYSFPAEIFL